MNLFKSILILSNSITLLIFFVFVLPFSFLADIFGKKIIGNFGLIFSLFGYVSIAGYGNGCFAVYGYF